MCVTTIKEKNRGCNYNENGEIEEEKGEMGIIIF